MAGPLRTSLATAAAMVGLGVLVAAGVVWSGAYNVAADDPHWAPVHAVIEAARTRSITGRAAGLEPPDLADPERIRQGSGNYDAMCAGCHLAPGMAATEMSRGLYPPPPDLSRAAVEAAEAFWVVKHGIKASGMPAWGGSMDDAYIWNMVAFLQAMPSMDADQYRAMVAGSGGHDHGGGETHPHHDNGDPGHHGAAADGGAGEVIEHRHADGTVESHPAPPAALPATAPDTADDGHDHQH